jgi:LmbE family N-acetylglucosaminyl deacetylase
MASETITFAWDVVMNHPDHERIEETVTRAVRDLPGSWKVTVAPSNRGWRISVREAAGRASASVEWGVTSPASDVEAALRQGLYPANRTRKEPRRG